MISSNCLWRLRLRKNAIWPVKTVARSSSRSRKNRYGAKTPQRVINRWTNTADIRVLLMFENFKTLKLQESSKSETCRRSKQTKRLSRKKRESRSLSPRVEFKTFNSKSICIYLTSFSTTKSLRYKTECKSRGWLSSTKPKVRNQQCTKRLASVWTAPFITQKIQKGLFLETIEYRYRLWLTRATGTKLRITSPPSTCSTHSWSLRTWLRARTIWWGTSKSSGTDTFKRVISRCKLWSSISIHWSIEMSWRQALWIDQALTGSKSKIKAWPSFTQIEQSMQISSAHLGTPRSLGL